MENESSNDNLIVNPYFKILYPNQKYKNSIEYKRWIKSIKEKMGENGIEMHFNKDKIVIYKDLNKNLKCPICNEKYFFCSYCKRAEKKKSCCIRGFIKDILNNELYYIYINTKDEYIRKEYIRSFIFLFIPLLFNISLFFTIFVFFYLAIIKNDVFFNAKISNVKWNLCPKIIIIGFILLMSLIYMIFFYSLFLFIIIISIPFKFFPKIIT